MPFPPVVPWTNTDRVQEVEEILRMKFSDNPADDEDSLGDLLSNAMHYAHIRRFDFDRLLRRARGHFQHELMNPDGD